MANFTQAMKWMEEGKKVRIDTWGNKDYYWYVPDWNEFTFDNLWCIKEAGGFETCFIRSWIESEDWVIYYEKSTKREPKLKILAGAILNEDNPEFFAELLKKGVDAVEPEMKKQLSTKEVINSQDKGINSSDSSNRKIPDIHSQNKELMDKDYILSDEQFAKEVKFAKDKRSESNAN